MMKDAVDLSPELQRWIRLAGFEVVQGTQAKDGRTVIWNKGGEVRYFIGALDGWYVLTSSDRMGPEAYEFAGLTMPVIEKHLYGLFGGLVRSRGLPRLRIPFQRDRLRPGYSIGKQTFAGRERHTLIDHTDKVVAIAGVEDLVELSHYLDASGEAIEESYLSVDGKPILGIHTDEK